MTPDSWELPAYTAGDVTDPQDLVHRRRVRDAVFPPKPRDEGQSDDVRQLRRRRPTVPAQRPAPSESWEDPRVLPRDTQVPESNGPELYAQNRVDQLKAAGFESRGKYLWGRPIRTPAGKLVGHHYVQYVHGFQRPTDGESAPWHVHTGPGSSRIAFGNLGRALTYADADAKSLSELPTHQSSAFPHWTRLGAPTSRGRRDADDWLERNQDFEADPRSENERWMDERQGDEDEGYTHWEPDEQDYTYEGLGDASGQSFRGEGEGRSHHMPGHFDDLTEEWENRERPSHQFTPWITDGHDNRDRISDSYRSDDDDSYEEPEHEQHLGELGFNWEPDDPTSSISPDSAGKWVRHQHDPEGNHVATHRIYPDPEGRSDRAWHVEHESARTPGFFESYTQHRFPSDAITRYHHNAENALLPSRGYEPHRNRFGVASHWTRVDHDPQTGAEYHHEISNQPPSGEDNHQGWLGQTFADHMNRSYAPNGTRNQNVQTDLADVVREHDRIGRGLHPGGSQDYRLSRDELLSDPSVARLGEPHWAADGYGDGKISKALWQLPHPNPPHHTVFDPTAPGHSRQVESDYPWINAEATYNWDKGGYDVGYTHDGERYFPGHEHFPQGAPTHIPGRQLRLPLGGDSA